MTYLVDIPRNRFALGPLVAETPAPALVPVAVQPKVPPKAQLPVAVAEQPKRDRSVDFGKLASHDPFLAKKIHDRPLGRGIPSRIHDRDVTGYLVGPDLARYNAIVDAVEDVDKVGASTARTIFIGKVTSILAYGALLATGASFDVAVFVGIPSLVALTVGKLYLEQRGARLASDRNVALFEQLEALPVASDDPRASARAEKTAAATG